MTRDFEGEIRVCPVKKHGAGILIPTELDVFDTSQVVAGGESESKGIRDDVHMRHVTSKGFLEEAAILKGV